MGLTMREKQAVTKGIARRYVRGRKKTKSAITSQVTELTGYNRSYATRVLRDEKRRLVKTPTPKPNSLLMRQIPISPILSIKRNVLVMLRWTWWRMMEVMLVVSTVTRWW